MFRFLELALHGWDLWSPTRIPLDRDVILVQGPNGSGKTTLLDALRQILNAPKLSSKRRLHHYLRRPDEPALLWAVVSNRADRSGRIPFVGERIVTEQVTLGCAVVPGTGGAPEKRYVVLPNRATIDELERVLLKSRDFLTPERYSRVLERAGVTSSLMQVLAIEQGKTNSLFEMSARTLFRTIIEMLGDRVVLDRYREARRRYEDSKKEVDRQASELLDKQANLNAILRRVQQRRDWEAQDEKVKVLEAKLPAADLQQQLKLHAELKKSVSSLHASIDRLKGELSRLASIQQYLQELLPQLTEAATRAKAHAEEAERHKDEMLREETRASQALKELRAMQVDFDLLPEGDLAQCEADLEAAQQTHFEAKTRVEQAQKEKDARLRKVQRLRDSHSSYPEEVEQTLALLSQRGIEATLLCDVVNVVDASMTDAAELALGDARYALLIGSQDEDTTFSVAREQNFPGPVYSGSRLGVAQDVCGLHLSATAPEWLREWTQGVSLQADGSFSDARGTWVASVKERVLGGEGRKAALREAEIVLSVASQDLVTAHDLLSESERCRTAAEKAANAQRRRQTLLAQLSDLDAVRARATELASKLQAAKEALTAARGHSETAQDDLRNKAQEQRTGSKDVEDKRKELEQHQKNLIDQEEKLTACGQEIQRLRSIVPFELRVRAEQGELDSRETIKADLERARREQSEQGDPPGEEVKEEARHLESNVKELEHHVDKRRTEAERACEELSHCRQHYLTIIDTALHDYRQRVIRIAQDADVAVTMQIPRLQDNDQLLDEAEINVSFGFDGKQQLPMGDSSFSGGQQVIAALTLLMGMAETDGQGFFMVDEPFAHLSLDRIDDVGRFLRSTRAQFILTAPTTLDRAQLDPASQVIVTRKKRPQDQYAPVPLVAVAA